MGLSAQRSRRLEGKPMEIKQSQSVENLLEKNKKLSNVSPIEVPEETMELKIFSLKKLTEENVISLEKGDTFVF